MSPSIFQTNLLIPILFLFFTTSQSLRFDLQSGHTKCISEDIKINALVVGKYTAVAPAAGPHFPDSHKITVRITSPSGKSIHHTDKVEYGNFAFTATETGDYLACFWAAEHKPEAMLGVEFDWRTGVAAKDWSNIAKKGHIDVMELELKKLEDIVRSIHDEMFYLREKEEEMQVLNIATNTRMITLTGLSFLICLSVAGLQIWHLKSFFVKTGMLPSVGVIKVLCRTLKDFPVQALIVDPVMVSTSGDTLAEPSTLSGFREELLPLADIVTPNLKEASALLGGVRLENVADMCVAAKLIHKLGPRNVLVKGGDLPDTLDAVDVFFDGECCHELSTSRIKTRNTHGTGCTLASCIAAELAKGSTMLLAVKAAKHFVESALHCSKDLIIGCGPQGPFDHLFELNNHVNYLSRRQHFNPDNLFLYAVTDSGMNKKWGRSLTDAVKAAIEGGASIIQLREKDADTKEFVEAAMACKETCQSHGVPLLINDRVDVALACDADGVHVGQSDMPARMVRTLLGPNKIIGVSCKTIDQAQQAWLDGADYIGCGGVFPTTTKANNRTIGLDGLKSLCLSSKLPVVAIGGIGLGNACSVMEIDVPKLKGVAVVSSLFDRECVLTETQGLRSVLMDTLTSLEK